MKLASLVGRLVACFVGCLVACCVGCLGGCNAALDQRLAIVDRERVLAITSEPPEVSPGTTATLTALIATPTGTLAAAPTWSLCTAPKPPTEDNAVADGCVANQVTPLGTSPTITATIPVDACRTYGPDVASTGFRPRDPDPTGGYYQPIRAAVPSIDLGFGFTRITCNLANAPGDVAQQYLETYVANENPTLDALALPASVAANSDLTLSVGWPAEAVESYVYFDPDSETLTTRRESMRLSWFATGGSLDVDSSAVGEADASTHVSTTWHTPSQPGTVFLWFVLRDSRGGIATTSTMLDVR
jgi:hypothetical protein